MYWNSFSVLPSIVLPLISRFAHIGRGLSPSFAGLRGTVLLSRLKKPRELRALEVVGRLLVGVLRVVRMLSTRALYLG